MSFYRDCSLVIFPSSVGIVPLSWFELRPLSFFRMNLKKYINKNVFTAFVKKSFFRVQLGLYHSVDLNQDLYHLEFEFIKKWKKKNK